MFEELPAAPSDGTARLRVSVANVLQVTVPAGPSRMAFIEATVGLSYPDGTRISFDIDRGESLPPISRGRIGVVLADMYEGRTPEGCALLAQWGLERSSFRYRIVSGPLTIYAYEQHDMLRFDVLDQRQPAFIVRALARRLPRDEFVRIARAVTRLKEE